MTHRTIPASSIRGALAPWRYEASLNRWAGGRARTFREATADLIGLAPGDSVLDLGCGPGDWTMAIARRVGPTGAVVGVDLAKPLIAGARRKARRAGLAIDYRVASVERLPLADASVDVAVSSLVFHHLAPDVLERAAREIHRVLKPGGRLVVVDFQSLDQAGHGHHRHAHEHGHPHRNGHDHGHGHGHPHAPMPGSLHDHQPTLAGCLQAAGLVDVEAEAVAFGQPLTITRARRG